MTPRSCTQRHLHLHLCTSFPAWEGARKHNPCPTDTGTDGQHFCGWTLRVQKSRIPFLIPAPPCWQRALPPALRHQPGKAISCPSAVTSPSSLYPDILPLPGARGSREVICYEMDCSLCRVSTAVMASVFIGSREKRGLWAVFHHVYIMGCNSCMETARFQLLTPKSPCFPAWTCQVTQFITK